MLLSELINSLMQMRAQLPADSDNPRIMILRDGELRPDIGFGVISVEEFGENFLMFCSQDDIEEGPDFPGPHLRLIKDSD
jgi:hypothetical protein